MTAVMLACYPELFSGGAIIAGLPFATANTLPHALERMRGQGFPSRLEMAARAHEAAGHAATPPTLSVWHGTNDTIVDPVNATAIVNQWRDLHGLGDAEGRVSAVAGHRHESWSGAHGRVLVERYDIKGMGHGTPLATRDGQACGTTGPHMLEAGICSTTQIASSWGLITGAANVQQTAQVAANDHGASFTRPAGSASAGHSGVGAVIEDALRAAGLMR